MKKRILSILTAVCIAASTIFGGAIPAKAVTTRVMTTKFEIYQGSTKVAETSFAPSNSFNDVGYDYAKKWNVTLQGDTEYKLVVSWGTPLYEGYGAVSAQVVDMYAGGTFTDTMNFAPVKSLSVSQEQGMNSLSQQGSASCVIKSDGYGVYPMHIALDRGDGDTTNKFKINLTFETSGAEGSTSSTVPQGSNVPLTASTQYSESYYNFSWTKNGTPISGATGKTYTVPTAAYGDVYVATISRKPNGLGCTGSESWTHTFTVSNETFSGPTVIDGLVYNGGVQKLFADGVAPTGYDVFYYTDVGDPVVIVGVPYDDFWKETTSLGSNNDYYPSLNNGNAGTYKIHYFIANSALYGFAFDENYNSIEFQCLERGTINCTIAKANPTLDSAPTAVSGLKYDGTAKVLVTAGAATNGTVQYRVNGGAWSDAVPTAINAGSYSVEYRVKGKNNNYNTLENANYKLTVNVAAGDIADFSAALAQTEYDYTGSAIEAAVTVASGGRTLSDAEYSVAYENNINAGTATALITGPNWSGTITKTFTINKKELTNLQIADADKIYDGSAKATAAYITFDGAAVQDDVDISADIAYCDANAGTDKTVTASALQIIGAQSGNYLLNTATVISTGTISPMSVTVTAADKGKTYGEADPVLEYTASGVVSGETLADINLSRENGNDAGTYTITTSQADGANPNYDITFENGVFTINPKEIDINWGPVSALAYTGSSLVPSPVVTNLENGDDCVLTAAVVETADGAGIIPGIWTAKITSLSNPNYKLPADVAKSQVAFEIVNASQDNVPAAIAFPETIRSKADGRITNVDSTMEYRKDSENSYTAVSGSEISNLEGGTYYIRYAAKQYYNPSADQTVVVYAGRMLDVTVPSVHEGYTLTADKTEAFWNDSATLTFALADGYSKTSDFAVKVNGIPVTPDSNGQFTITDIQENKTITVEGVADITAPAASIRIDSKEWTTLQDTVTQQHFYNTAQTVTVAADDVNLDKVYYHIADTAVTAADITDWTEYTDSIAVNANGNYIVYVKATDTKGNVAYINSDIIVYDDIAPVISGITDGATYYTTQKFIVTDVNTDTVTVNGTPVTDYTFAGNTDKEYIIAATDKAGNSTTVTVQMKPLSTLSGDIEDVSAENITDAVIENLENVKELLENEMSSEVTTASEKTEAQGILDKISTLADNITVDYKIIHGADSNWTQGSASTLGFTANGVFSLFKEVRIADAQGTRTTLVRDAEYTAQSGSTIVTLKQSYLDTLAVGQYKLEVVYDILGTEHIADCNFTVKAKPAPTPAPTATPEPTPTPAATKKPAAKVTAKPTATPEATEEPVEEKETETGTATETETGDGQQDETETITPQVPAESTSFPILPIIIALAAVVAVMVIIILKKKKEDEE